MELIIKFMRIIEPIKQQLNSNLVLPLNQLFSEASTYDRSMVIGNFTDYKNKGEAF
jgi:hypothetical protein